MTGSVADTLPIGPRRTAVAKAEVDVTVAMELMNMAIDARDWSGAQKAWAQLQAARAEVGRIMEAWILDLPGAEEWADPNRKLRDE